MGTEVREGGDESALLGLEPGLLEAEGEKGCPLEDVERAGVRRGMAVSRRGMRDRVVPSRSDIEGRVGGKRLSNVA